MSLFPLLMCVILLGLGLGLGLYSSLFFRTLSKY